MSLFYQADISAGLLTGEEARHAAVLRLRPGDSLFLTDGKGHLSEATVTGITKKGIAYRVNKTETAAPRSFKIHLAIAPTKHAARMEWMIEKCVEIGVDQISFVQCRASERNKQSLDRFQKVAISAMKQSKQAWLPQFAEMTPFKNFLSTCRSSQRFIAHVDPANPVHLKDKLKPAADVVILIGPEGDFANDELASALDAGWIKVSLGKSTLRTETAGLVAVTAIHMLNA